MRQAFELVACFLIACSSFLTGCGQIPYVSENRTGFAPWDRLPACQGITYVQKFTHDVGHDPIYMAKIEYGSPTDLQTIIAEFDLKPHASLDIQPAISVLSRKPNWFPLTSVTSLYVRSDPSTGCETYLWVDLNNQIAILERSWW